MLQVVRGKREREIRERWKGVEKQFGVGVTKICPSLNALRQCVTVLLVELCLREGKALGSENV